MPTETTGRPLLPQTAQMQSFTFAPPLAPRENQRSELPARRSPLCSPANLPLQTMYSSMSTTDTSVSRVRMASIPLASVANYCSNESV